MFVGGHQELTGGASTGGCGQGCCDSVTQLGVEMFERFDAPAFDVYRDTAGQCVSCTPYSCHRDNFAGDSRLTGPEDRTMSDSYEFATHRWEPLERWRHFARQARAILDLAASLHTDQPGQPEDWQVVVQHRKQPVPWWRPSVEAEWILLSSVVQEWIRIGDVRPVMARGPTQGRQVEFGSSAGGTRLFGTLACQLLFTITRVTGVAVCSACAAIASNVRP